MKKCILLYLVVLPALAFAQFPAPDSFQVSIHYIIDGLSDWCDGVIVEGPAYCNGYYWETPDTANTPATLTGYRVYKDGILFLSTIPIHNWVDTAGFFEGSFYATAVYENPAGESDSSNVVMVDDLPMAVNEVKDAGQIGIGFDLSQQLLIIQGAEYAQSLCVYNLQGVQMLCTNVVAKYQSLEGWAPGIYIVAVQDQAGRHYCKLVVTGMR